MSLLPSTDLQLPRCHDIDMIEHLHFYGRGNGRRLTLLFDTVPPNPPAKDEPSHGRTSGEVESMIDSLVVSFQDPRELLARNRMPESCHASINNSVRIDCRCVLLQIRLEALAENCLVERKEERSTE
jgi:hypothetical protein